MLSSKLENGELLLILPIQNIFYFISVCIPFLWMYSFNWKSNFEGTTFWNEILEKEWLTVTQWYLKVNAQEFLTLKVSHVSRKSNMQVHFNLAFWDYKPPNNASNYDYFKHTFEGERDPINNFHECMHSKTFVWRSVFQNSTVQINKTRMLELLFPFSDGDDVS